MSSDPVELAYSTFGPPDAPVLLLGSALGTTRELWREQIPALAERHRVIAYDHRGHGDSPVPDGPLRDRRARRAT